MKTKTSLKLATIFAPLVLLSGCASTGGTLPIDPNAAIGTATGIGSTIIKTAIDQKCHSEIQNNNYWKIASLAMTPEKQTQVVNNVCGCVTDKGMQSVTIVDITNAAIDSNARTRIVANAVANTMQTCYSEFVK